MTDKVKALLDFYVKREYRTGRRQCDLDVTTDILHTNDLFEMETIRLRKLLQAETPCIYPNDIFGFNRTVVNYPTGKKASGEELPVWNFGNVTPDYSSVINRGLDDILAYVDRRMDEADEQTHPFFRSIREQLLCVIEISERYRAAAIHTGNVQLANALAVVPRKPAGTFYEACLFFKIIAFSLRCCRYTHLTIGRFDQYMFPFFQSDLEHGIPKEQLFETLELFFISLNFDTDLYQGVQQGDNGQSMVLGGYDGDGKCMYNELSRFCMEASLELCLIDPKINLRVGKDTPIELYEFATQLTKKGLGFPQYCNDDIVIPGLTALGYDYEDALNYTVAACWEFIIPGCGADIPNYRTMNFPLVVGEAIVKNLDAAQNFAELMTQVKRAIGMAVDEIIESAMGSTMQPSPLLSLFFDGCLEKGKDISEGGTKYYNYGCHGAGIANAADALAAVKKVIYEDASVSKRQLLDALHVNFKDCNEIRNGLLTCPKMGNNDDFVDEIACEIMEAFAQAMNGRPNGNGGIWRAGTGSAMEYLTCAAVCPATADGRRAGEPYGSNFSPSIAAKLNGPLSVIQSFTKYDMKKIINGGPLTLEMQSNVFRNEQGVKKVARLVKTYIDMGGHQLQLNAIERERLLAAQKHPEEYPNLIVRVWGWSGYFCELDHEYQEHIISRTEFSV